MSFFHKQEFRKLFLASKPLFSGQNYLSRIRRLLNCKLLACLPAMHQTHVKSCLKPRQQTYMDWGSARQEGKKEGGAPPSLAGAVPSLPSPRTYLKCRKSRIKKRRCKSNRGEPLFLTLFDELKPS